MPNFRSLARSFAGGEITPELFSRMDLANFQTGLAKCLNFWTLPHGPAANRPGTEFVLETKFSATAARLIPFAFNTEQTFALEFGAAYVRFHTQGATLLNTATTITAITSASPAVVTAAGHGYANGDDIRLSGIVGPTRLNGRTARVAGATTNTFQLVDAWGNAISTTGLPAYTSGGAVARMYEVATPYAAVDVMDLHYVQSGDVLTVVHPTYAPRELRRLGATNWTLSTITFAPSVPPPTGVTSTAQGAGGGAIAYTYVVTSLADDTSEESIASALTTVNNDLTLTGHFNNIQWVTSGNARYSVYKAKNGVFGYIGQSEGLQFNDDNIDADVTRTPPVNSDPFTGIGNYPAAVNYAQQRRVFAGTNNKPNNVWLTRSGTEANMSSSIPVRDDDAITLRVAASQVNVIRNMVPLADLMLLTSGAEWRLTTANTDVLTPTSVAVKPQSYVGSSNVQPVVANNRLIFAENRGSHLQEVVYSNEAGGYVPTDLSILAPHLLEYDFLDDMAFMRAPVPIVWSVRADGAMLGLTYVPDQKVTGWHQHVTINGAFESICTISEAREDALYTIVNRTVAGRQVRYVERLHTRKFRALADAFFVDCGLTYSGAPITTVFGLYHLEGQTVSVLGDGAVFPAQVVTDGTITLEQPVSTVHVGLPITAELNTLPLEIEAAQAFGAGRPKNINKAYLRVHQSSSIYAGAVGTKLRQFKQRTTEPYGSPPAIIQDAEIEIPVDGSWNANGQLAVQQTDPLPLTVLSICVEASIGG